MYNFILFKYGKCVFSINKIGWVFESLFVKLLLGKPFWRTRFLRGFFWDSLRFWVLWERSFFGSSFVEPRLQKRFWEGAALTLTSYVSSFCFDRVDAIAIFIVSSTFYTLFFLLRVRAIFELFPIFKEGVLDFYLFCRYILSAYYIWNIIWKKIVTNISIYYIFNIFYFI